jgi:hypothetical protein
MDKGTGKQPNTCKGGKFVSQKQSCLGTCSSDDHEECCLSAASANNTTATNDADGIGLAASVVMLVMVSVSF